jgi:hypothetical protein
MVDIFYIKKSTWIKKTNLLVSKFEVKDAYFNVKHARSSILGPKIDGFSFSLDTWWGFQVSPTLACRAHVVVPCSVFMSFGAQNPPS